MILFSIKYKKPTCTMRFFHLNFLTAQGIMVDDHNNQASLVSWLPVNPNIPELAILRKANLIFQWISLSNATLFSIVFFPCGVHKLKGYLCYKTILCHKVVLDVQLMNFFIWNENNVLFSRYPDFCVYVKSADFKIYDIIISIAR